MRVERDDGSLEACGERGLDHPAVAEVDAVEGAESDGALACPEFVRRGRDPHSAARASSGGRIRVGSASSTRNGPTSVRRSARQCPPSASAIDRTYVPELTRRSSVADFPS